jgi:hypothetical protein
LPVRFSLQSVLNAAVVTHLREPLRGDTKKIGNGGIACPDAFGEKLVEALLD